MSGAVCAVNWDVPCGGVDRWVDVGAPDRRWTAANSVRSRAWLRAVIKPVPHSR